MPNLAFRIESIRADRYGFEAQQQLSVNMNITLGRLERMGQAYATSFLIKVEYAPPIASVEVKGSVQVAPLNEEEKSELEKGVASGQPPPQLIASIFSYVLPVLVLLTREIGLPPPVPIPVPAPPQQEVKKPPPSYV